MIVYCCELVIMKCSVSCWLLVSVDSVVVLHCVFQCLLYYSLLVLCVVAVCGVK